MCVCVSPVRLLLCGTDFVRCIGCPNKLHEHKAAVVYHVKRSQCSVVPKPIKVPQLETLAEVRERVDLWKRALPEKTEHLLVEVRKAREQLGKNKSYRKARVEGTTPEAQKLAKKKQKVCIVVLRPLMS